MPASDRSGGDETKQLLQELVENQRNLLQVQAQPQLMQHPHGYNNVSLVIINFLGSVTRTEYSMLTPKLNFKLLMAFPHDG